MKRFRQVIFTIMMVIGLALSVSAQKDDKKNRPPKDAPKVNPGQKPPRGNPPPNPPPKEDRGPKKPGLSFLMVNRQDDIV